MTYYKIFDQYFSKLSKSSAVGKPKKLSEPVGAKETWQIDCDIMDGILELKKEII